MTQDSPKRAALIGAGMVAATHVAACAEAAGVTLHAIQSRSPERARALADRAEALTGQPVTVHPDLAAVAADDSVDFAIILTPPDARAAVIRPLARAGKHILLEKPMGRTAREAREVVAICEGAGVRLGVVFQHRMRAASLAAARLVATSDLGPLGLVQIEVPWWRDQSYYDEPGRGSYARDGGGVLISQAIHTLDLALSLAGPVEAVRAMATTTRFHAMEAEDIVAAGLRFANGAAGSLVASTASFPGGAESITLHHDRASLRLQAGEMHVRWRDGRHEVQGAAGGTGGGADPMAFTHDWHRAVIEEFATAIAQDRDPAITGRDALAVHDLIDALVRSAREGEFTKVRP